ncbi:hypothetical protein [Lentilitoribacter sp. Alg239-R112]|uniref:hypothetical protein n=1 Tax=Lentilitoribacter sp. Alg239-R112 TaxID=2305987 RepID=UPI0013A68FF6|nr:hypothetical protein [Lentilitoribacter sp. Alg239-R112]
MIRQLAISLVLLASIASYSHADEKKPLLETNKGSMIIFGCPKCEPEVEVEEVVLEQGSQILDVRKVGENLKIYRTENWLGGSPVSYIHMPSNPNDKRFSALVEGPLDITPLPTPLDTEAVASIGDQKMLDTNIIGPRRANSEQDSSEGLAVLNTTDTDPVMASVDETKEIVPQKSTEFDATTLELRLN